MEFALQHPYLATIILIVFACTGTELISNIIANICRIILATKRIKEE